MAEKRAIIVFEFDTKTATKNIQEATKEIEFLKSKQKELDNQEKELVKSQNELAKAGKSKSEEYKKNAEAIQAIKDKRISEEFIKNASDIRTLSKEVRENNKILDDNTKFLQANEGSIQQLSASLADATARYNNLSKSERENEAVGGKLQKQIKGTSDELKKLRGAIGDNRMEVGSYSASIQDAVKKTGIFSKEIETLKVVQGKLTAVYNLQKAAILGNASAFGILKLAIAATGIGLLLIAVGSLVAYLTKTQEGLDWLSVKFKGLTTVVGVITDKFSAIGKTIFEAFNNPKQAIKDLIKLIEENLTNRVKAFAVIWDGIKNGDLTKLQDGIAQLATGVTDLTAKSKAFVAELNAARLAAEAIAESNHRLRDSEMALNVERAQSRMRIKELNLIGEDTTKSLGVRLKALKEASAIEVSLNEKLKAIQKEKIANIEKEQALTNNLTEDNQKLADEKIKLAEIDSTSIELRTTLQNKLNTIINQEAAEIKKVADERRALEKQIKEENEADLLKLTEAKEAARKKEVDDTIKANDSIIASGQNTLRIELDRVKALQDAEAAAYEDKLALATDFGNATAEIFAANLTEQGLDLENFQKQMLILLIDSVEKTVIASIVEASVRSLASGQSIATGGIAGVAQAAILTALIKGASGFAKAQLSKESGAKFERGGGITIGGNLHSQGGTKFWGSDGTRFEAEKGENLYILNRAASSHINSLSRINQSFGGAKFADGGIVNRGISDGVNSEINMAKMILQTVQTTLQNTKVVTKITDLHRVNDQVINNRAISELR